MTADQKIARLERQLAKLIGLLTSITSPTIGGIQTRMLLDQMLEELRHE